MNNDWLFNGTLFLKVYPINYYFRPFLTKFYLKQAISFIFEDIFDH